MRMRAVIGLVLTPALLGGCSSTGEALRPSIAVAGNACEGAVAAYNAADEAERVQLLDTVIKTCDSEEHIEAAEATQGLMFGADPTIRANIWQARCLRNSTLAETTVCRNPDR